MIVYEDLGIKSKAHAWTNPVGAQKVTMEVCIRNSLMYSERIQLVNLEPQAHEIRYNEKFQC